jgi:hypothetical protein
MEDLAHTRAVNGYKHKGPLKESAPIKFAGMSPMGPLIIEYQSGLLVRVPVVVTE